jgi:hypothetical protein
LRSSHLGLRSWQIALPQGNLQSGQGIESRDRLYQACGYSGKACKTAILLIFLAGRLGFLPYCHG